VWFVPLVQLLSVGALEGMSALRRSEDLLSLKTRRIVIQNEDSSYPPAGAILAMDSKGRGGTVITQDVSLNSIALLGQTTAGILTYSDVSGLLVNSMPIGSSSILTNLVVTGTSILGISAEVMGPLTANSVNSQYASITNLDVSNATIANLDFASVSISSLDASNATITNLDASSAWISMLDTSSASISSLDASYAIINLLTATNGSITNLDVSNATIANLEFSSASVNSLDASNGVITYLDVSAETVRRLDASSAIINSLTATTGSITNLDVSNASIANLIFSSASVNSLDASNGVITYLDVSAATFNRLDASSATINSLNASSVSVPGGVVIAARARIGQDISENFVFINAFSTDTIGRICGSNRSDGTLQLGANNAGSSSNIVLNADGSTTINGLSGETVGCVRGSDLPNGSLQLGANADSSSNIVLNANGVTVNAPSNPAITVSDISLNIFKPGTSNPEIRVDATGTSIYTPLPPPIFSNDGNYGAPYMFFQQTGVTNFEDYNPIVQPTTLSDGVYYILGYCDTANLSEAQISTIALYKNGRGWVAGGSALGPPLDSDTPNPGAQLKLRVKRDRSGLECKVITTNGSMFVTFFL
jgi:hypothetical protein